jgi:hypothetical protein
LRTLHAQNAAEAEITRRLAEKLRFLDSPRAPQGGLRVQAEALGLTTDAREWRRQGGTPPALAHERPQPTPVGEDALDAPLERRAGFNLRRAAPYGLEEADRRLRAAFGDDLDLRCAGKARLAGLGLLRDGAKPADVPKEVRQLKQAIQRDMAEEATRPTPARGKPGLQERLQALKQQIEQLLDDQGDADEGEPGAWQDPRRQNYVEAGHGLTLQAAAVRTDRRGRLVDATGKPLVLRSYPY